MKQFFSYLSNKCKQYFHRLFYISMDNTTTWSFMGFICSVISLDQFITEKIGKKEPYIVLVSNNLLFKSIVFIYCLITCNKLVMISPKFPTSQIFNTILARRGVNFLLIDHDILLKIKSEEKEEGIDILQFFTYCETTLKMLELLDPVNKCDKEVSSQLRILFHKGRVKRTFGNAYASILSPGTTSQPSIINVPYKMFGKSILDLSYFMGLKTSDKVSVIADFELYPTIYTILGLLNGTTYVQLTTDNEVLSHTELKEVIASSNHKPNVFFISTNNFRNIWDGILQHVYSKRYIYILSKYSLLLPIVNYFIRKEVRNTFGKQTTKIHILNEELGFNVFDVLKRSKIMFSTSYGFLEQGNFLAFKDPSMLKNKQFMLKPGGSIVKESNVEIKNIIFEGMKSENQVGDICINASEYSSDLSSGDIGLFVPNTEEQGDRKYLYVTNKKYRASTNPLSSIDLLERSMKDTFLIRDCFIHEYFNTALNTKEYEIFIEPRENLLDTVGMSYMEYYNSILHYLERFKADSKLNITKFAILKFDAMRNFAGKLQYYIM